MVAVSQCPRMLDGSAEEMEEMADDFAKRKRHHEAKDSPCSDKRLGYWVGED